MKSTNNTKQRSEKQDINYRAAFTGGVMTRPMMFNPSAEQIRALKNLPEDFNVNEPNYTQTIKGEEYRRISLWCEFNPNKALKLKKAQYSDKVHVKYEIFVSDRNVVGAKSGKTQIMDTHNQSAWIKLSGKKSLENQILDAQKQDSPYKENDPLRRMDPANSRIAKQGEVALYQLIFNMSTLDEHRPNEDPNKSRELHEFKLGEDPTKTIENMFHGDLTSLNMLLASSEQDFEGKEYFLDEDQNNELGLFLGVSEDSGRLYQRTFSPFTVSPVSYITTFRKTDRVNDYTAEKLGESKLRPEAVRVLTNEDYPWNDFWNNSLDFQEVTIEMYEDAKGGSMTTMDSQDDDDDDDMPF